MDEAVLRIVLDDAAGGPAPAPGTSTPAPLPSPTPPNNAPPAPKQQTAPSTPPSSAVFDPVAEAQKRIDNERRRAQVEVEYLKLNPPAPPEPPEPVTDWMKALISPAAGANPHVLLEGQSGSGKSLAAKHIAFERMKQGQEVNVVDTHNPEAWGGANQVFQGAGAGTEAADFLKKILADRKEQATESKLKGEVPDFKPMTLVFSDFARLMKDTPQLGVEFATLLTEARKFRISVVADTTALTGAASGIKGVEDVLNNFGQKVKFYAPTSQGDARKAEVAGKTYETPQLPDYKDREDFSLVKPAAPPAPPPSAEPPFDPRAEAEKRRNGERRSAQVDEAYKKQYGDPNEKKGIDHVIEVVDSLRGAIGGALGTVTGAVLDVVSGVRKSQAEAQQKDYKKQLLKPDRIPDSEVQFAGSGAEATVPAVAELGDTAAAAGGELAAVVPVVGAVVAAVGAAVVAFNALTSATDERVKRLAEYSPAIAQAQSENEVRTMMNDLRRSREYGEQLAAYTKAQNELEQNWEEVKIKLLMDIVPILTGIFKAVSWLVGNAIDEQQENVDDPTTVLFQNFGGQERLPVPGRPTQRFGG